MIFHYLGHSCFLLEAGTGVRAVTDPYGEIGFSLQPVEADVVTVSHGHYDHCNVRAVGGDPLCLSRAGIYRVGEMEIEATPSFHDNAHGRLRGSNLIFKFRADGMTVCHLGDIGEPCSEQLLKQIGAIDVLLVPVGGKYTVDARSAKEYVDRLHPSVVIPMHYKTADLNIDIGGVESFLALFDGGVEVCRGAFALSAGELRGPQRVILMEREGK